MMGDSKILSDSEDGNSVQDGPIPAIVCLTALVQKILASNTPAVERIRASKGLMKLLSVQ